MGRILAMREFTAMNPSPRVRIQTADFDLSAEVSDLRADDGGVGAVAAFVGTVRDRTAGQPGAISAMELEHSTRPTGALTCALRG